MNRKTTVYLEDDVLKTMRVAAARSGKRDYQVVEEVLRAYLGLELLVKVPIFNLTRMPVTRLMFWE